MAGTSSRPLPRGRPVQGALVGHRQVRALVQAFGGGCVQAAAWRHEVAGAALVAAATDGRNGPAEGHPRRDEKLHGIPSWIASRVA